MRCPKCNYNFDIPAYIKLLAYMIKANKPLFGGLLKNNEWENDLELVAMKERNLIQLIQNEGFIVTQKGRDAVFNVG